MDGHEPGHVTADACKETDKHIEPGKYPEMCPAAQSAQAAGGAGSASRPHLVRQADAVALAERAIADVCASLRSLGADQRALDAAAAQARAGIASAAATAASEGDPCGQPRRRPPRPRTRDLSRETVRDGAGRRPPTSPERREQAAVRPAIPDLPGVDLHPDPGAADTVAGFLECLRNYRVWAGKPSFRVMERHCDRRFAASTICTALRSEAMPGLDMVLTIITACGGPEQHQREFASGWRRLTIGDREPTSLQQIP
jgi:hypothetical protein